VRASAVIRAAAEATSSVLVSTVSSGDSARS
jgi:hypothetical protein